MGATKEINLFLNFKADTPKEVLSDLALRFNLLNTGSVLSSGYRHACGKPCIEFYLDVDREQDCHVSDNTYYLRYCNTIKDNENVFEAWLSSMAPYVVQVNGHHVGTIYNSVNEKLYLICIEAAKVVYKQMQEIKGNEL